MKKILIFAMLAICSIGMNGQDLGSQDEVSKKKEINGIKLSEEAVYADVIEMATDDNEAISLAQQKSINLLQTHVIEIFAKRMNMSKADVQEIWNVIDDKCQNIVVRKGDLLRVFSYIMKDAIGLGPKKPKQKDIEKYLGDETKEEVVDTTLVKEASIQLANAMTSSKDSINVAPAKKAEEVVAEKKETAAVVEVKEGNTAAVAEETAKATTTVQVSVTIPVVEEKKVVVVEEPAVKVVEPQPETKVVEKEPLKLTGIPPIEETKTADVQVPVLCQEMIEQGNMNKLLIYLGKKKAANELMFGNSNTMQYVERCYIAVIDKKSRKIVALLDKGATDRVNFMSKQMDHFKNYKTGQYAAIFVQEY